MSEVSIHRWAIDDILADVARVEEDGTHFITVPVGLLPGGARVGQVLNVSRSEKRVTVELDERATQDALGRSKAAVEAAMADSKRRDPGGDVSL